MAYLGFNDGTGYVTLRGVFAAPMNRFRSFQPSAIPVGPSVDSLATGARTLWQYRTDYLVALELPFISPRSYGGESGVLRAQRLCLHLLAGGAVDVGVEDDAATAVNSCRLAPSAQPSLSLESPQDMLYTFASTFRSSTPFVSVYGGVRP